MELIIKLQIEDGKLIEAKVEEVKKDSPIEEEVSIYARFMDEGWGFDMWTKDPEVNLNFLKTQETLLTARLREQGYLFLNEVYEALGIPKTKVGQVVGWVCDGEFSDNYVSFNIYNKRNEKFVNGLENVALIDFNVDGNILDVMEKIETK